MTVTELEILESLDFHHDAPCEHSQHDTHPAHSGPAALVIDATCPECPYRKRFLMCRDGLAVETVWCSGCGFTSSPDNYWTIVGEV